MTVDGVAEMPTGSSAHASTIVMVPRETFSRSTESLVDVCRHRENGARMLFVDAGSPPRVQQEVEHLARQHDVALLRVDRYLSPNQARNLAMQHVTTTLAVFVDNDVQVSPGWLVALERCAAETGAAIVVPMIIAAERGRSVVHLIGGDAHVAEQDGKRTFGNSQWRQGEQPADVGTVTRVVTEEAEFHCMLVSCAWFRQVGGLDEELLSLFDHSDFSMHVRDAGGTVWVEPDAVISYGRPRFIDRHDRAFYVLRWSEHWNARSARRFQTVWRLDVDPYEVLSPWAVQRRRYGYRPFITPFNRLGRVGRPVVDLVDRLWQRRALASWERSRQVELVPRFTHTASWQNAPPPGSTSNTR